jgi:hypothetical protein
VKSCPNCNGTGHVCENHPRWPWGDICCDERGKQMCKHGACHCGGAGMPCPTCCRSRVPLPGAGQGSIVAIFVPVVM